MRDGNPIHIILIVLFLVCEFFATLPFAEPYRLRVVAAGLTAFGLAQLF